MNATLAVPTLVEVLVTQLGFSQYATRVNAHGITDEESLVRPQAGGNSANWILGHITSVRQGVVNKLGDALPADERLKQYRRGSDGDVVQPIPFHELLALYDRLQPLLIAGLQNLSDEQLTAKSPISTPAGPEASLGAALTTLVFHESYHAGQLGVARRLLGKPCAIK